METLLIVSGMVLEGIWILMVSGGVLTVVGILKVSELVIVGGWDINGLMFDFPFVNFMWSAAFSRYLESLYGL